MTTSIPSADHVAHRLQKHSPGQLAVIAGWAKSGKSVLARQIAMFGVHRGDSVLYVAVDSERLRRSFADASPDGQTGIPVLCSEDVRTDRDVLTAIRRAHRTDGITMAIVDAEVWAFAEDQDEMIRDLKRLAMELSIAIVATMPLSNRSAERPPTIDDLPGDGTVMEAPDKVFVIATRPDVVVRLLKDRHGPTGDISYKSLLQNGFRLNGPAFETGAKP